MASNEWLVKSEYTQRQAFTRNTPSSPRKDDIEFLLVVGSDKVLSNEIVLHNLISLIGSSTFPPVFDNVIQPIFYAYAGRYQTLSEYIRLQDLLRGCY
jgi:hypothetical protein